MCPSAAHGLPRLRGRIRISPGFWLLLGWFAAVNGWRLLTVVLLAALLHEAGHWAALRLLGGRLLSLRLGPLGAVMEGDWRRLSYGRELAVALAGPAVNLLCALALRFLPLPEREVFAGAHFMLGVFNLLPIGPLDGGRALRLALTWLLGPRGEAPARWISAGAALLTAVALAFVIRSTGGSLWLTAPIAGAIAAFAGEILPRGEEIGR